LITIVVPTLNRAYTLRRVLPSLFEQDMVDEIVLVSDGGTDDSEAVFKEIAASHPAVNGVFVRNEKRGGAANCRNIGARHARNEYILFCDDDVFLARDYAAQCLAVMNRHGAGAVSGRIIYLRTGETMEMAADRFGDGVFDRPIFNLALMEWVNSAKMVGDLAVPFTHGIVLTKASLLRQYGFDEFYLDGNGYREESDFQLSLTVHGIKVMITSCTRCYHMAMSEVRTGGQRTARLARLRAMVKNNNYFYDKYYEKVRALYRMKTPRALAKAIFVAFSVYRVYVEPSLLPIGRSIVYGLRRRPSAGGLAKAGPNYAAWMQVLTYAPVFLLPLLLEGCT
jgi:glycosyltransferase involved in cell wall biosynthesis